MGTQNVWVFTIVGSQKCRSSKVYENSKNYFVGTQICGYSKFMDTQNLLIHKFVGNQKLKFVVTCTQFCGISTFLDTQNLLILKLCGH